MRNCRLQRLKAIVQRQQCVAAKRDDERLLLDRKHRRLRLCRTGRHIDRRCPLLPLGNGLLIDPVPLRQRPQARLTMLHRATDGLCRGGAPMQNLTHSASLHSLDKIAPSKSGIKDLAILYFPYPTPDLTQAAVPIRCRPTSYRLAWGPAFSSGRACP